MAHFARNQRQSPRRSKIWNDGPLTTVLTITGSATASWTLGQTALGGVTIARIHGVIDLILTATAASSNGFIGAVGLGIVTTDAFLAGGASLPDPLGDQAWGGWLYHQHFDVRSITATLADGVNASSCHQRIEIDTKAMRKMKPNETLMGRIETTETGTATMLAFANTRMLVLLS